MEWNAQFVLIIAVTVLAVISPGPDFAVTIRNSLMHGRRSGIMTATGIALGVTVHIVYTILGLGYIMAEAVWLLEAMKYVGAVYLIWLGISSFRSAKHNSHVLNNASQGTLVSNWVALKNGFICNALNPKTALFFIALFTQVVDPKTSAFVQAGLGVFISAAHFFWFSLVALLLTDKRFQTLFERAKSSIERLIGVCLIGLGAKLAFSN